MSDDFQKIAKTEANQAVLAHASEEKVRLLSTKIKKKPSILVLGRDDFSDNSKYLYLALLQRKVDCAVHWGTFNRALYAELSRRNLPVVDLGGSSARILSILMETACVVYCTNPVDATHNPLYRAALAGAHKFQLWHGIGLKSLDLQNIATTNLLDGSMLLQLCGVVDIDEILSPSSLYDDQWRGAFGVERIFRAGYPRNEVLLRPAREDELINVPTIPAPHLERGFVLYAPTFTIPARRAIPAWQEPRLLGLLEGFADKLGMRLAIKPHPFDRDLTPDEAARLPSSILLLPGRTDVYPLLNKARVLVTDASSLVSDFLLCDKPVLFFRSKTLEQKTYLPQYMPELPGPHVREETAEAFAAAWDRIDETAGARRRLRQLYFETDPLAACESVIGHLLEIVCGKA